jgi:hypothetical protein
VTCRLVFGYMAGTAQLLDGQFFPRQQPPPVPMVGART